MRVTNLKKCLGLFLLLSALLYACKIDDSEKEPLEFGTVTDHQGNEYQTVKIGGHWWMTENLRTTTFKSGIPIPYVSIADSNNFWAAANSPLITSINSGLNGVLYNGYVLDFNQDITPDGWHIATEGDWEALESHIGMNPDAINSYGFRGGDLVNELVSQYSEGWPLDIVLFGTNEHGFNAKPSGCRINDGRTNISSNTAFWWVDTEGTSDDQLYRYIDANELGIFRQYLGKNYGMSIRCVKN